MAGISDIRHELCLALALWNGEDPILKERMFGLTGPQGNHGEDVKEYWWYLEGLPSHALLRWRYHYPQAAFPYERARSTTAAASQDPEFELLDTGVFDDDRYWSVEVTYAKASPTEVLARITVENHGPDEATLDVLPTLWFRNTWSWDEDGGAAAHRRRRRRRSSSPTTRSPATGSRRPRAPTGRRREALFCENETNAPRVFGVGARRRRTRRTASTTTSSRARPRSTRTGSAPRRRWRYRADRARRRQGRAAAAAAPPGRRRSRRPALGGRAVRRGRWPAREAEADEFYARARAGRHRRRSRCGCCARPAPGWSGASRSTRTTCAGGWTATRAQPPPPEARRHGRNSGWRHLDSFDVLAMPDPWEYPWFAAWDLGVPRDPVGAPRPGVREVPARWCCCASGSSIPTARCRPTSGTSTTSTRRCTRWRRSGCSSSTAARDREFLERVFQKLLAQLHLVAQPRRTPTATTSSAAASSASTTSARSTGPTSRPASSSSRPTARRGWPTTRSAMLVIAIDAGGGERRLRRHGGQVPRAVRADRAARSSGRVCYDADDGFFYDRLIDPSGESDAGQGADASSG